MKRSRITFLLGAALLLAASCSKDIQQPEQKLSDVLIVNNGNWNSNDASISSYNLTTGEVAAEVFFAANGQKLGDLAQDIIVYEDKILIAVSNSKIIFVCDKELKVLAQITKDYSPRAFCIGEGKIYVSYYEGLLGEIDPSDWSVRTTEVGPNPEGVAYSDGKVYVANSGGYVPGYDKTVSVVDTKSFKQVEVIEVNTNPGKVAVYGQTLYVTSFGNYADIPAKLQAVSLADKSVADLPISGVNSMVSDGNGLLYVLSGEYDENWTLTGKVSTVDAATATVSGTFAEGIANAYSISYSKGHVFVGASDYRTDGTVHIYKEDGTLLSSVCSEGLNPIVCLIP